MNLLAVSFLEYLQQNLVLTIILAVVLVLIVVFAIALAVNVKRAKKQKRANAAQESGTENEQPAEEPSSEQPVSEPVAYEQPAPAVYEQPAEEVQPKPVREEPVKTEPQIAPAPVQKQEPAKKPTPAPAKKQEPVKKEPAEPENDFKTTYTGKWMIISKPNGRFSFELTASNGEKMLESGSDYSTLSGAKGGIETFKRNIAKGNFDITRTKTGDYLFKLFNANGGLMATSSDYSSRTKCENAMESTKRFAATAEVVAPKKTN